MIIEQLLTGYMRRYTARLTRAADSQDRDGAKNRGKPTRASGADCPGGRSGSAPGIETDRIPMLYLHIPFCKELCPFCTFYRIRFDEKLARRYFAALRKHLRRYHELGYEFRTAYFGGGTPTVLPDELVLTIKELKKLWDVSEISVETNPADLTKDNIELLKSAGVNRLSVGVQSFQDSLLQSVNRIRKYGTGDDICSRLAEISGTFDTLNVDLIFGLEGQTVADVASDIGMIKKLGIDQVTSYPLMRSGAEAGAYANGKANLGWEKKAYHTIRDLLEPEYSPSSAWCFSKNRGMIDEYIVEHASYAGAGSGAFGLEEGTLVVNVFSVENYIEAVEANADAAAFRHRFSKGEYLRYRLLMQMFGGVIDISTLMENQNRWNTLLVRTLAALLRITGAAKSKTGNLLVTERGAFYALLLMKHFFEGVGKLRGSCVTAHNIGTVLDTAHSRT